MSEDDYGEDFSISQLIDGLFSEDAWLAERCAWRLARSSIPPNMIDKLTEALKFNIENDSNEDIYTIRPLHYIALILVRLLEKHPSKDSLDVLCLALSTDVANYAALGISYMPDNSVVESLIDSIQNSLWEEVWIENDLKVHRNLRKLKENQYAAAQEGTINASNIPLTSTVINTLGAIGDRRAIDVLRKFSNHEQEEISDAAKRSLRMIMDNPD